MEMESNTEVQSDHHLAEEELSLLCSPDIIPTPENEANAPVSPAEADDEVEDVSVSYHFSTLRKHVEETFNVTFPRSHFSEQKQELVFFPRPTLMEITMYNARFPQLSPLEKDVFKMNDIPLTFGIMEPLLSEESREEPEAAGDYRAEVTEKTCIDVTKLHVMIKKGGAPCGLLVPMSRISFRTDGQGELVARNNMSEMLLDLTPGLPPSAIEYMRDIAAITIRNATMDERICYMKRGSIKGGENSDCESEAESEDNSDEDDDLDDFIVADSEDEGTAQDSSDAFTLSSLNEQNEDDSDSDNSVSSDPDDGEGEDASVASEEVRELHERWPSPVRPFPPPKTPLALSENTSSPPTNGTKRRLPSRRCRTGEDYSKRVKAMLEAIDSEDDDVTETDVTEEEGDESET